MPTLPFALPRWLVTGTLAVGCLALTAGGRLPVGQAAGRTVVLESSALRLEVTARPYAYRVIEKATSTVLVAQAGTSVTYGGYQFAVASANGFKKRAATLDANLHAATGLTGTAHVTFSFISPQVLRVVITGARATATNIAESFTDQGEHYYGVWEYPFANNLDDRGIEQDFIGRGYDSGVSYDSARAPFYMTSRGYGVYVQSQAFGHYALAGGGRTSFNFNDARLQYDIIAGPAYADILSRYNALAGPADMPPLWAFDSEWWRDDAHGDYHGSATNAQGNVLDDMTQLQNNHIHASMMKLDRPYANPVSSFGWGNMDFDPGFPQPQTMIDTLRANGMHVTVWIANRASGELWTGASAKGWIFPGYVEGQWPAIDIRIPAAYAWFQSELDKYAKLGVQGYKIDRGEEGEMPTAVENKNAALFPTLAGTEQTTIHGSDWFVYARNLNDTGRRYAAVWNGDAASTADGLNTSIKTALRAGALDFPMWGSDTGGYSNGGGGYYGNPTEEVFARWFGFSAYSPMMEVLIGGGRTPWYNYDQQLVDIAAAASATHHDLIPYTRSAMYQATRTGLPIMRALYLTYPTDPAVTDRWDEYGYGDGLLVAPVTSGISRTVYLPAGRWIDYNDRATVYTGPLTVTATAPLGVVPVYAREGAIIPRGDILQANNTWTSNWQANLRVEVFPSNVFTSTFAYYTGAVTRTITSTPANGGLTVQFGDLGTPGVLNVYCQNLTTVIRNGVTLNSGDYTYDAAKHLLTVSFTGATTLSLPGASGVFGQ